MPPLNILRWGRAEDQPEGLTLRAGPLSVRYEEGGLRYLRLGDREVLRRVYVAVRDHNWETILPTLSEVRVEQGDDRFTISFLAEHREGPIDFAWRGTISGDPAGAIDFIMDGAARSTFLRNRVGFCILHPPDPCAGAPCLVEHDDGTRTEGSFPPEIAPDQPFVEIRAIAHEVTPGVWAEVRFAGDVFEMEDQRNWTDDSYKTYCTPLRLPFPVEVAAGTRVAQSVALRLRGVVVSTPGDAAAPVVVAIGEEIIGTLPRLGLGLASHGQPLSDDEVARLRALHVSHLRVDLHLATPGWRDALRRALVEADALGVALELALFVSDAAGEELPALAAAFHGLRPPVARWLIFHAAEKVTGERWVALARRALIAVAPGAPFGGGTNSYFTELNRERPAPGPLDLVAYSINPQVHAFDDASLMETLACQATTVESARAFVGNLPIAISPLTLRPRFNPNATGPEAGVAADGLPFEVDPRQMSLFGAAWTIGSLAALAACGVASATYYETTGPRGVMETAAGTPWAAFRSFLGGVFPLYHALADAGEFAGGQVLRVSVGDRLGAAALALRKDGRTRVLLANLHPAPQRITLRLSAREVQLRQLDETNAEAAMRSPEAFRAEAGQVLAVQDGGLALDLLPYAIARIDVAGR
jgi:hypothetical protein